MRQALGTTVMLNFIIIFIVVTFAFLSATLSYMKAYRVNSRMSDAIEKYEGYNDLSNKEINKVLNTLGYIKGAKKDCVDRHLNKNGVDRTVEEFYGVYSEVLSEYNLGSDSKKYYYCIYKYDIDDNYYRYGIETYIRVEFPVISKLLKIKVYKETERIYNFSDIYSKE